MKLKDLELTLELYQVIIPRIIDISLGGANWYSIDQDTSLSDYERFILNENLGKPSLKRIEKEFKEYKEELIKAKEMEMLADWGYMTDPRMAFNELEIEITNIALELKRIIDEQDEELLTRLVDAYDIAMDRQSDLKARQDKKDIGQHVRSMCNNALNVIIGYNVTRSLTTAQQNQMKSTFKDIFAALQSYQPALAKSLIQDVRVDDILVTEEMKQDVLKEL